MAYDGMYGDLSTRGTTNEILAQVLEVQNQVLVSEANVEVLEASASDAAVVANASADIASMGAASADSFATAAGLSAGQASVSAASAAQSAIDAETNSEAALLVAQDAQSQAYFAVEVAGDAIAVANGIAGTANTALANSTAAVSTANAAEATANGIAATANTALTNSNTAVTTANAASATAGTANTNASAAVSTANSASSAAATAQTTADNAQTSANNAQTTANNALPKAGGKMTGVLDEANITSIASAATTNIGAGASNTLTVTGTTTITSFGTASSGTTRRLVFNGAVTITHNATTLILQRGVNITTAAGDVIELVSLGGGNWRQVGALQGASPATWGAINGTLSNQTDLQSALNAKPTGVAKQLPTAWVLFTGTGTPGIRDSFNVSSITRVGTGNYTVNFASTLSNTAYSVSASWDSDLDAVNAFTATSSPRSLYVQESIKATGSFRVLTGSNGTSSLPIDFRGINLQIFGGN